VKHVIAFEGAADKIADQARADGKEATVFKYEQPRTRLTLFGVEVVSTDANGNRQIETILFN
jgi:hypothetical protein